MARLCAYWQDNYVNIPVTRIEREDAIIYAYCNNDLVGVFDMGVVAILYVSRDGK